MYLYPLAYSFGANPYRIQNVLVEKIYLPHRRSQKFRTFISLDRSLLPSFSLPPFPYEIARLLFRYSRPPWRGEDGRGMGWEREGGLIKIFSKKTALGQGGSRAQLRGRQELRVILISRFTTYLSGILAISINAIMRSKTAIGTSNFQYPAICYIRVTKNNSILQTFVL